MTIANLFDKYDENGDGKMVHIFQTRPYIFPIYETFAAKMIVNSLECVQDLEEFQTLGLELVKSSFSFNGRESLDTLDVWQLDLLRRHRWKRRVTQELKEGDEANNAQNVIGMSSSMHK